MKLKIKGQKTLGGEIEISGAKNSALPVMAASLLTKELYLKNIPFVQDIFSMKKLIEGLGGNIEINKNNELFINTASLKSLEAPYDYVKQMRASILVLGPLIAKYGEVRVAYPGGCKIGARPVDLHLENLKKMGAEIKVEHGTIIAKSSRLSAANISFEKVSVTGTENIMMAAVLAKGTTIIENAAKEPEVVDLANLLKKMGARIEGEGSDTIEIIGVEKLHPVEYRIIPDRIEAGTYLIIGGLMSSGLIIKNIRIDHIKNIISKIEETGIKLKIKKDFIKVRRIKRLNPIDIETQPFPGFPTDMQAQFMVMLTQSEGRSIVRDTIFPGRFHHVDELLRLGANIKKIGNGEVSVIGKTELSGAEVVATDLRASASLVIAGLIASGETIINDIFHLERGYERFVEKLQNIGSKIDYME
jgi:UDP-N-acetylglucosamine 1-carboxyvinyltransferase